MYAEGIMLIIDEAALTRDNLLMGSFADGSAVKSTKYYILIFKNNTVKVGRINLMSPYNQKLRIFPVTFLLASFTLIKFVLFF